MSAITGRGRAEESVEGSVWSLDALLAWRPRITWDVAAISAIVVAATVLRYYDLGARAIHHDESLHATFSWYFYKGQGYTHDPLMHGPFLFHAMALVYGLFGVTDATARFVPAAFGAALVLLPWLLRGYLGRVGAVAAAFLLAFSPTLLYFSRFVGAGAQDIILAVTTLLIVIGIWRFLGDGRSRWLNLLAGALSVSFATKEVTYIIALVFIVWLNGLLAFDLAGRSTTADTGDDVRRLVRTAALFPFAWLIAALWPALSAIRARLRLAALPRSAGPLLVLGLFTAPQFAAGSQVLFGRLGYQMNAPSRIGDMTNEQLLGGVVVGLLIAATTLVGLSWRRRDFLICAAIFWGIYVVLFTTFFTNPKGFATGIWGSLDYWLVQHGEKRGEQPVFYYAMLTPVYEYLTLAFALIGIVWSALRGRLWTSVALALVPLCVFAAAALGDGAKDSAPFALVALVALLLALRKDLFRSFLAFWAAAIVFGLSTAGEKMPWLEVHIALPLALLAALTINEIWTAWAKRSRLEHADVEKRGGFVRPALAVGAGGFGLIAAAMLMRPENNDVPAAVVLAVLGLSFAACVAAGWRRHAWGGAAAALALFTLLAPLTVRDGWRAAFEYADTPKEMLIYTQTSPNLRAMAARVDELARVSGQGRDLPITIDQSEAFTWPWAWYLRNYTSVLYIDAGQYVNNPDLAQNTRPGSVLITLSTNAAAANAWPGIYGAGERFPHRWWFPEDGYRTTTWSRFTEWVSNPAIWRNWANFLLYRDTGRYHIGSIDAVAFFPADFLPASSTENVDAALLPRTDSGRLIVGGQGAGRGAFNRPAALALDPEGNIVVADSLNNRVQKYSPEGELLAAAGGQNRFREPWGVATDAQGNVYVADTWAHRIQKLDPELRPLLSWGGPPAQPNSPDPGPLELFGPRAIAVDRAGNLWVTDTGHHRVLKFSADGRPLGSFGSLGIDKGQFREPVGIALAPTGDILVADTWNGRVQRFDSTFRYLSEFRVEGWDDRNVENKPYLAVLPDGSVLVAVPDAGLVHRFSADGHLMTTWDRLGDAAAGSRPLGLAADTQGHFWVSDAAAGEIVRLSAR